MGRLKTTSEFIEDAIDIHGYVYDYSNVEYTGSHNKINIICSEHGKFAQTPDNHLSGKGCIKCGHEKISELKRWSKEKFIKEANKKHSNRYDYKDVIYKTTNDKIIVYCPTHGKFEQFASCHLNGIGCPDCRYEIISNKLSKSTEQFIEDAKNTHGKKYRYTNTEYINDNSKVEVECLRHGPFKQKAGNHLMGKGCPKCKIDNISEHNRNNPSGWSYKNWIKSAKKSDNFDSFKVYIIKLFNENEKFYKLGRTYLTVDNRLKHIPYKYKILKIINGKGREICELETKLKNKCNDKYKPLKDFGGMYECFNSIDNLKEIINE